MVNVDKINDILVYLAENVPDLTITKIMKLFYYVDFVSFAEMDMPVTNDVYYKLPYGPVPSFIKNEINNLTMSKMLGTATENVQLASSLIVESKTIGSYKTFIFKNGSKKVSLKNLSQYEADLLNRIVTKFKNFTAKELTNRTHREKPYLLTNENSVIEYKLAKTLNTKLI